MALSLGIVGLPNVGKSTLFNALTNSGIDAENYPFCTIDPNVGIVTVPDMRLDAISAIVQPKKTIAATVQFVDIAGLVAGAASGEGLGNQFLSHIRETHAIMHIVRCHQDKDVTHVSGKIDPADDVETINIELGLADIETVNKALERTLKHARSGDKEATARQKALEALANHLNTGQPIRTLTLDDTQRLLVKQLGLLTAKPVLYVANVDESDLAGHDESVKALKQIADTEHAPLMIICARIEEELSALDEEERRAFLAELDLKASGLDQMTRAGYALLGLQTYFTAGPQELRAWTIDTGMTAREAAGVIHTDFAKHFIRAEVISYADFIKHQGEAGAKAAGVWRLEGKEYVVQDGDVLHIRHTA